MNGGRPDEGRAQWFEKLQQSGLSAVRAQEILALAQQSIRLVHPPRDALTRRLERTLPRLVQTLDSVETLAAGWNFTLALRSDAVVMGWGRNGAGQLGDGTVIDKIQPVPVHGLKDVVSVSAGFAHSLALLGDGTAMSWGANWKGQLGDGTTQDRLRPGRVSGLEQPVTAVASGPSHNLAVLGDGSVVGWGANSSSELANSVERVWTTPGLIDGLKGPATAVAAGSEVSAALFEDGSVQAWGGTLFGDEGLADVSYVVPHSVDGLPAPVQDLVSRCSSILLLLTDGSVFTYSHPHYRSEGMKSPARVGLPGPAVAISSVSLTSVALLADGSVVAWGLNDKGQMGTGDTTWRDMMESAPVQGLSRTVRAVCAGNEHCAVIYDDATVAHWGGDYPISDTDVVGADPEVAVGSSKLGGRPDLPPSSAWPETKGSPQAFVCQLNMAEVSPLDSSRVLPKEGLLSFFYDLEAEVWGFDPGDRGGWHVVYTPPGTQLARLQLPPGLRSSQRFPGLPLSPARDLTLPPSDSIAMERLRLAEQEQRACDEALFEYTHEESPSHRVLGHPQPIQGDMQLQCQLVTSGISVGDASYYGDSKRPEVEHGATEWILLLQIDSDENAEMLWGDCGRLYYWIRRDDLTAKRFDQSWLISQCY